MHKGCGVVCACFVFVVNAGALSCHVCCMATSHVFTYAQNALHHSDVCAYVVCSCVYIRMRHRVPKTQGIFLEKQLFVLIHNAYYFVIRLRCQECSCALPCTCEVVSCLECSDRDMLIHSNVMLCAGICFGHRKLIQLSPKKTWEGFIGGCLTTVVASWYMSGFLSRYKWMTCPRTVCTMVRLACFALES